ncbi:MAG: twin-arginine translocase TatA/TatE family subunit [Gemmatimonadota bacterium]|nr:twin-arginine translocase TatA/TatE family subunit [Gemmatimonadota bacterium]MDE3127254.1 twin-arginine translocase TatA/TatE family subunit [Gemmatimonadota bacterium]MDE3174146.1 twin-arginine translocase TatA/TatE family subunit [Gemmatimonadota bacterium]MDE3214948.1 twin-arginine translocase TatA/TatE family subunit [Gemmatimonadota bacterium]
MFEGFGPEKLLFLFLIVLLFFGGKRIPEIGSSLGKGIREFKKGIREVGESVNEPEVPVRPVASLPANAASQAPVAYDDERRAPKRLLDG